MEIGLVQRINIDDEMQQAYLDYAMSVIVARAIPDARDGLKPVHRRILYAMYDMGLRPDTPYKKSARIVGEVLGKYHPHGDAAVYEAMARMAQDFSMRYPLVDGQGNFGSVDGDAPAAMRYTEARLAAAATQMLSDIQKNTINFESNFDGTLSEPTVLPAAVPNLLVNGTTGIAVGMATSIPPHNLGEVVDAVHYMLENWDKLEDINVEDLMAFVQGPDFPTGGIIIHEEESDGLISAYSTGRGRVTVQASAHLEEMERGRNRIIINELPYMTNKSSLIERIASLVREERLEGIADLRDESDRQGMRIVIELTKTANPETVLRELYKSTPMQSTFSIIMLALVDGEPRVLSLKQALRVFIEHRLEIVRRRSEFDLEKARQRAHILEGLLVALHNLDEIIALIRKSPDAETARDRMIKRFKLTTIQAQAILDMQLRRLAALERKKIEEEFKEIQVLIKELEALLRSPKKMRQVVDQELQAVRDAYADRRRTHIAQVKAGQSKVSMLTSADLKPDKLVWLSVSPDGLIARSLDDSPQRLGGKDAPVFLAQASTRDTLYLVTEQGEAVAVPVHALPEAETPQAGLPLHKVSALKDGQILAAMFTLPAKERGADAGEQGFVVTASRQGMLKKSAISELPGPSAGTFTMVKINPGDRLGWIRLTKGADELLLVSVEGMAIRFSEEEVRPMGLVAAGVMGIKLQDKDELAGMEVLPAAGDLFLLASDGSAKRVPFDHFSRQGRYGQGLIAWKLPAGTRIVGVVSGKDAMRIIVHLARLVPKTIRLDDAPLMSRAARGQSIRELKTDDPITRICIPWEIAKESTKGLSKTAAKSVEKTQAKKVPKSTAKIVEKPPTKPTSKTTSSGAEKSTTKPTGKATEKTPVKPATKTAAKAVVKSSEKPPTTTAPKVANKPPAKPATKVANKPPAKPAPKPVTKVVRTNSSKSVPKPAAKTVDKALAKSTPKPVAKAADKAPAKPTTKPVAKAADKAPAKSTPKPVAKAADKAPVKPTTKPAAKAADKAPTKPTTKPVAKVADKAPAKSAPKTVTKAAGTTPITTTGKTTGQAAKKSTSQTKPKTTQPKVEKSPGKQVSKENAPSKPAPKASATTTPKENNKPAPSQKPANKKSSTP